jgi:hypothetical protein
MKLQDRLTTLGLSTVMNGQPGTSGEHIIDVLMNEEPVK